MSNENKNSTNIQQPKSGRYPYGNGDKPNSLSDQVITNTRDIGDLKESQAVIGTGLLTLSSTLSSNDVSMAKGMNKLAVAHNRAIIGVGIGMIGTFISLMVINKQLTKLEKEKERLNSDVDELKSEVSYLDHKIDDLNKRG